MVETIRSLGHSRLLLYVLCVTIAGNPAGMRLGRERQRQFVSGHARAAVETAVDVPDHGHSLSRQGGNDNDNPIQNIMLPSTLLLGPDGCRVLFHWVVVYN